MTTFTSNSIYGIKTPRSLTAVTASTRVLKWVVSSNKNTWMNNWQRGFDKKRLPLMQLGLQIPACFVSTSPDSVIRSTFMSAGLTHPHPPPTSPSLKRKRSELLCSRGCLLFWFHPSNLGESQLLAASTSKEFPDHRAAVATSPGWFQTISELAVTGLHWPC